MTKKHPTLPCTPENVAGFCADLGFKLDANVAVWLSSYLILLTKWNRVMNLVGPSNWETIITTLIVDSFHLANFIRSLPLPSTPECRDLGAGAGLPGLPLRMLWQQGRYTLVEAREKRALFLRSCLASIHLPGVFVYQGRAEAFMADAPKADLTISRAFLPWEQVLECITPFSDSGSLCLFLTLSPLPSILPQGWTPILETGYTVNKDIRYFWALKKS